MIAWGTTRVVLSISGSWVIKIVRPRPLRMVQRLLYHTRHQQVGEQLQKFDGSPLRAVLKYVFAGWYANRQEWLLSQRYPHAPIARVTHCWCGGLLLVQQRGLAVTEVDSQVINHPLWPDMVEESGSAEQALTQFARFGKQVLLVDLGWPPLLQRFALRMG